MPKAFLLAVAAAGWAAVPAAGAEATYQAPLDERKDGEVKFAAEPKAEVAGGGVEIAFAASAATDAEVAILDAAGQVVRHLAAGLLGPNAPEPFKKDSLAQEIVWDRRDDAGKPTAGGPFRVRVRLGVQARMEKTLGWDGNTFQGIRGLAVGKSGEVHVLTHNLLVLDRNGKYLRTIMPYPAGTPRERTASIGHLEIDGERVPVMCDAYYGHVAPLWVGLGTQVMAVHPDGHLIVFSGIGDKRTHGPPRHLLAVHPEGGAPEKTGFVGPMLRKPIGFMGGGGEMYAATADAAVCSPDGQWIYLTQNIYRGRYKPRHGVFRVKWSDAELGQPFLGKDEAGNDDGHFSFPEGLAVDGQGKLYVCDRGNNRVMVFDPEGRLLRKIEVPSPTQVAVHSKSGEIYVLSRALDANNRPVAESPLLKFAGSAEGKAEPLCRLDARDLGVLALDASSDPPRLWVASGGRLMPVTDKGRELIPADPVTSEAGLDAPRYLAADPDRHRVLVREGGMGRANPTSSVPNAGRPIVSVDLDSGRRQVMPVKGATDVAVDADGNMYVTGKYAENKLWRYDPVGSPLAFPGLGSNVLPTGPNRASSHEGLGGHLFAPGGDFYILRNAALAIGGEVDVYGPDWKLRRTRLVRVGTGDCGLGVDARGNIYVGSNIKLADQPLPKEFAGKVPAQAWIWWRGKEREAPWKYMYCNPYLFHLGAVLKFGPDGGAVYEKQPGVYGIEKAPPGSAAYRTGYLNEEARVAGAKWHFLGVGPIPASSIHWGDPNCICTVMHLAADPWGRVYAPNCFRFGVEMLDTNGNRLMRIGRYGNADDAGLGPGKAGPPPGEPGTVAGAPDSRIRFVYPRSVSWAREKLYVLDGVSRYVTVVRFASSASAECAVP